jgi:hypothetical protein
MTTHERSTPNRNGERGVALIAALLLLMIVSGLCATMAISGSTETVIARNHQVAAEARSAAEAGAIHAVQLVMVNLQNFQANGFATNTAAVTGLLDGPDNLTGTPGTDADNGSLEALGIPRPPARVALNGSAQISYEVRVFDEDDAGRGTTLLAADIASIGEDALPYSDGNRRIVVRSVGYAGSDAVAIVEATIAPLPMPAILTDGDLTVTGNATLTGPGGAGSVHSNSDLDVSGSANIVGNAHASGAYSQSGNPTITGTAQGGQPTITVPTVQASDHLSKANFILNADGTMTNVTTGVTAACNPCGGAWTFGGGTWSLASNAVPTSGMYYVRGSVSISGSPGTPAAPATLGIIAEGSIDISGGPDMQAPLGATGQPMSPWLVTNGDLEITGSLDAAYRQSQILVREQLSIAGNADLLGQITVDDAASISNLVTQNRVTGSAVITNNGLGESIIFAITGWRWGS